MTATAKGDNEGSKGDGGRGHKDDGNNGGNSDNGNNGGNDDKKRQQR